MYGLRAVERRIIWAAGGSVACANGFWNSFRLPLCRILFTGPFGHQQRQVQTRSKALLPTLNGFGKRFDLPLRRSGNSVSSSRCCAVATFRLYLLPAASSFGCCACARHNVNTKWANPPDQFEAAREPCRLYVGLDFAGPAFCGSSAKS